jgi:hypothetical protein
MSNIQVATAARPLLISLEAAAEQAVQMVWVAPAAIEIQTQSLTAEPVAVVAMVADLLPVQPQHQQAALEVTILLLQAAEQAPQVLRPQLQVPQAVAAVVDFLQLISRVPTAVQELNGL